VIAPTTTGMEEDIRGGLSQVFWNPDERRLRTPFRLGTTLSLLLFVVILLAALAAAFDAALDFGSTGDAIGGPLVVFVLSVALLAITRFVDRRHIGDVGLAVDRTWGREFTFGLAAGGLMAAAAVGVAVAAGVATVEGTVRTGEGTFVAGQSLPVGIALSLGFFLLLAFFEELVFRGYVLVNLAEGLRGLTDWRRGVVVAVAASAVLFGLAHAANPGASAVSAVNITLFGLLLGGAYALTDSLAIPVGLHTAWNFALGPVFGTPVSGLAGGVALVDVELDDSVLTGGDFGIEGGLLALLALAVGAGVLVAWIQLTTGELSVREQVAQPNLWTRN